MFSIQTKYVTKERITSDEMVKKLQEIFNESHLFYGLLYGFLSEITPAIKSKSLDVSKLTDIGFLCREMENLLDELRKECKARKELCGSIIAFILTQNSLTDIHAPMKSKGDLATGSPDMKMQVALPKKKSPEYYQLTDHFKVPRDVAESGVLKLDWKTVVELCTKLSEEGKPLPAGFGKKYPQYSTIFRKRKS
jgi:hypothetical protein